MNKFVKVLLWLQQPVVEIRFHLFLFLPVQTFGVLLGTYTQNRLLQGYAAAWAGWTIVVLLRHWRRARDGAKNKVVR